MNKFEMPGSLEGEPNRIILAAAADSGFDYAAPTMGDEDMYLSDTRVLPGVMGPSPEQPTDFIEGHAIDISGNDTPPEPEA